MIATVKVQGQFAYICNEKGQITKTIAMGADGQLVGYTHNSVTIKKGKFITIYNEDGQITGTMSS